MQIERGERVFVTGGTGVIGAWVVRELLDAGLRPVVLTRGITTVGNPVFEGRSAEVETASADIEQPWSITEAFARFKAAAVVHLASVKPWQIDASFVSRPNPVAGVNNIINGTTNVLEAARHFGVKRVVYGSSKAVYREITGRHAHPEYVPLPETWPCDPRSMYGIGKLSAELICRYYAEALDIDVLAVRFGTCYGPFKRGGQHPAELMIRAALGEPNRIRSDRFTWSELKDDYVYNRDVARGIVKALFAPQAKQFAYNLGSGTAHSLADIAAAIREAVPGATIDVDFDESEGGPIGGLLRSLSGPLDIAAAERDFGYAPAYDLVAGARETASFYQRAVAP